MKKKKKKKKKKKGKEEEEEKNDAFFFSVVHKDSNAGVLNEKVRTRGVPLWRICQTFAMCIDYFFLFIVNHASLALSAVI